MWILDKDTKSIQAKTEVAPTTPLTFNIVFKTKTQKAETNDFPYSDSGTISEVYSNIVTPPHGDGIKKDIRYMQVYNSDNINHEVTFVLNDDSNLRTLFKCLLEPSWSVEWSHDGHWAIYDENGLKKNSDGKVVVTDPIGNNSFDTTEGSPIPTFADPWVGVLTDYSKFIGQTIAFKGNASGASIKGTIYFTYARSLTNVPIVDNLPINVDDSGVFIPVPLSNVGPYFSVGFKPDAGEPPITYAELTLINYKISPPDLTRFQNQTLNSSEPLKNVRALIEPSLFGDGKILGADRDVFGAGIVHSRISQISVDFTKPISNNLVTSTVVPTGTTLQANGQATLSTGIGLIASARLQSDNTVKYNPGREIYVVFTARFTTPTSANSDQRIGLYDDNNGFFLGYDGLVFGFTKRSGGTDTFTALTAVNGDLLNRSFSSNFTRNGRTELFDPTKLNVFRIRFGWLGSSIQKFEIQSPDGIWILIHTNKFPNSQIAPGILTPHLPVRAEVIKTAADLTDLILGTGSWDAGVVMDPYGFEPSQVKSRTYKEGLVSGLLIDNLIYTVTTGRNLKIKTLIISVQNVSLIAVGSLILRDGLTVAGTQKETFTIPASTNQVIGNAQFVVTYPEGKIFETGVFADVAAGTLTYSVSFTGYEESE